MFFKGTIKLSFYSQFWFLNETSYDMLLRFKEGSYVYDPISLSASNSNIKKNRPAEEVESEESKAGGKEKSLDTEQNPDLTFEQRMNSNPE